MKCPTCNTEYEENITVCENCGIYLAYQTIEFLSILGKPSDAWAINCKNLTKNTTEILGYYGDITVLDVKKKYTVKMANPYMIGEIVEDGSI
jgi:hypothetical protein